MSLVATVLRAAPAPVAPAELNPAAACAPHEALRLQLGEWVPPYHVLAAEGQLAATTPASALPEAVQRSWAQVAERACQSAQAVHRHPGELAFAWQQRWCAAMQLLASSPNYAAVLARSSAARLAAQHLVEELDAAWALEHREDIGASLMRHVQAAQSLEQTLSVAPSPTGHDLAASWHAVGRAGELRMGWTPPGDSKHAPATLRVYADSDPSALAAQRAQLARCAGQSSAAAAASAASAPRERTLLAELPRATSTLVHNMGEPAWGMSITLVPVSAFGIEGAGTTRPVSVAWPALMPATGLRATPASPLLEQREFYRNLDAVAVQWRCSPSEHAAPEAAQLLRYDVYRTAVAPSAESAHAPPHFSPPFDALSPLGPWGQLPGEREFVGSTAKGTCELVDRPGAARLREGVHYVVAAVGLDEQRAVAQPSCDAMASVVHDVAPLLTLARAGGDRLVHPTHFERDVAAHLRAADIAERKKIFAALPEAVRRNELQHFWDVQSRAAKQKWRDDYPALLGAAGCEQALSAAAAHLPKSVEAWAALDAYIAAERQAQEQIAEHWRMMPMLERHTKRFALMRAQRQDPAFGAATSGLAGHQISQERVFAWAEARDEEDVAQAQRWWERHSRAEQNVLLIAWLRSLPREAQRDLAFASYKKLDDAARTAFVQLAPEPLPDGLYPIFFAWQSYVSLGETDKLALIGREVSWWSRAGARLRYAVRPLDIWLAFERASAVATWGLGVSLGWLGYSLVSPARRRRPRAPTKEEDR